MKKGTKRKTIIWIALIICIILAAAIGFIIYNNQEDYYEFNDMPENKIDPLEEIDKMMSLNGLSDRERELWYKINEETLARYNPTRSYELANQIYENQLYRQIFGEAEFNKTYGLPGSAAFRHQQLKNRLVEKAWIKAFGPNRNE